MATSRKWTRDELLVAFHLYNQTPFGKISHRNPEIINIAALMNRTPSSLSMKMANIASCDPSITSTGRTGLSGAAKADRLMWQEMTSDWESFHNLTDEAFNKLTVQIDSPPQTQITSHVGTDKAIIAKARVGQRQFRLAVLSAYDFRCCITGVDLPELLVASHIIPWSHSPSDRLNPSNGLCLSPLYDKAFDLGLFTLNQELEIAVSKEVMTSKSDYLQEQLVKLHGKSINSPNKFAPSEEFLAHHRQAVFRQ